MRIRKPDNTTVDITLNTTDINTKSEYGWTYYTAANHKNHVLSFDFGNSIVNNHLPEGSYTEYITFREGTSSSNLKNMSLHGIRLFINE